MRIPVNRLRMMDHAMTIPRLMLLVVAVTLAGATFSTKASAQQILLTINASNPAAVTFTPTGNHAVITNSDYTFNDGIDLTGFFKSTPTGFYYPVLSVPTLTDTYSSDPVYNFSRPDDLFRTGGNRDLNLADDGTNESSSEGFYVGSPAFTGLDTIDLSGDAAALPVPGTSGNIYAGNEGDGPLDPPTFLGTFIVVPEAGTGTFVLLGGAILLLTRWYRRKLA